MALVSRREELRRVLEQAPPPTTPLSGTERWRRDFEFWIPQRCRFVDGYWTPIRDLHADFVGWNIHRDCDLPSFRALLDEAGVFVEEVRDIDWCYGLVLGRLLLPEVASARRPRLIGSP